MKRNLCGRLERLESLRAAADRAKAAAALPIGPSAAEIIREHLRIKGFVQTGNESMAETTARALGIAPHELRQLIAGSSGEFKARLLAL